MKVVSYCPGGEIPSARGFSPAIVAEQFARHALISKHVLVSLAEQSPPGPGVLEGAGELLRLHESALYRRLFRKLTRIDPYPLHVRMAKWINAHHSDLAILHAHHKELSVSEIKSLLPKKVRVVIHSHTDSQQFCSGSEPADAYLCVSEHNRQLCLNKGFPVEKLAVVSNGVNTSVLRPDSHINARMRSLFSVPSNAKVLTFFGRKLDVKGYDQFLRIAHQLLQESPSLIVFAIGPTPSTPKDALLSNQAWQECKDWLQTSKRFFDVQAIPQALLANYLKMTDVCLLPSRAEPQGMAMIEAMGAGTVVVSCAVDGINESVLHGVTGYLADNPEDTEELLSLARTALYESCSTVREKAVERVAEHFSWPVVTAQLEQIYLQVAKRP